MYIPYVLEARLLIERGNIIWSGLFCLWPEQHCDDAGVYHLLYSPGKAYSALADNTV